MVPDACRIFFAGSFVSVGSRQSRIQTHGESMPDACMCRTGAGLAVFGAGLVPNWCRARAGRMPKTGKKVSKNHTFSVS
jgi:hypothetical protein